MQVIKLSRLLQKVVKQSQARRQQEDHTETELAPINELASGSSSADSSINVRPEDVSVPSLELTLETSHANLCEAAFLERCNDAPASIQPASYQETAAKLSGQKFFCPSTQMPGTREGCRPGSSAPVSDASGLDVRAECLPPQCQTSCVSEGAFSTSEESAKCRQTRIFYLFIQCSNWFPRRLWRNCET